MAARCEHCRFWRDTVFKGTSATGWGVWWGDCTAGEYRGRNQHSLMLACDKFERKDCGGWCGWPNCACARRPAPPIRPEPLFPRAAAPRLPCEVRA